MAPPITGPFFKQSYLKSILSFPTGDREVTYWEHAQWIYRQRPPFTEPLSYKVVDYNGEYMYRNSPLPWEVYDFDKTDCTIGTPSSSDFDEWSVSARNKAYDRFIGKLKGGVELGQNLAEYRSSRDMITSRATQLYRAARAVRRFRWYEAASLLGIERSRVAGMNLTRSAQAFGRNWLEFWFGWSPLISDIYGAMEVLQAPFPYADVRASAQNKGEIERTEVLSGWETTTRRSYHVRVGIQAQVTVSNPNLYLANEMGLVNPLSLAWNLLPFSWLVDWVANVGQILDSFSDLAGLTLTNQQWSRRFRNVTYDFHQVYIYNRAMSQGVGTRMSQFERFAGSIPGPVFTLSLPERLSVTRAATAISLLVAGLDPSRKSKTH